MKTYKVLMLLAMILTSLLAIHAGIEQEIIPMMGFIIITLVLILIYLFEDDKK